MFVFLSKFLPQFIQPLGLSFLLVVGALLLRKRQRARTLLLAPTSTDLKTSRWFAPGCGTLIV